MFKGLLSVLYEVLSGVQVLRLKKATKKEALNE